MPTSSLKRELVSPKHPNPMERDVPCLADPLTSFKISSLLPYELEVKRGPRLIDGLKEYYLLLKTFSMVLDDVDQNNVARFDPLVGENACQIRAMQTALIFKKYPIDPKSRVNELQFKLLVCKGLIKNPPNEHLSLVDVLDRKQLEVHLSYNEIFLIRSFLLAHVKVSRPPREDFPLIKNEYTDTKKIKEIADVGSMFADRLVKKLRGDVSKDSVGLVQELAALIDPKSFLAKMVSNEYLSMHRNLHCIPYFWATCVLMKQALYYKIPIVLLAELKSKDRDYEVEDEMALFFEPTEKGYCEVDSKSLDSNSPALILMGCTCREFRNLPDKKQWKEELVKSGPIDLILAYAATHRQYPNISDNERMEELQDPIYESYKQKAQKWGSCMENPSRFFLSHAYCDLIDHICKEHPDIDRLFVESQKVRSLPA